MPFYQYHCDKCNKDIEIAKKISEYNPKETCPNCFEPMHRKVEDLVTDYTCKCGGFYGKWSK